MSGTPDAGATGTAILTGRAARGDKGRTYKITITAANGISPVVNRRPGTPNVDLSADYDRRAIHGSVMLGRSGICSVRRLTVSRLIRVAAVRFS